MIMSTPCITTMQISHINLAFMGEQVISSRPLFEAIGDERGSKARWAKRLGETHAVLTNWKTRGIPASKVGAVAEAMGITYEDYMARTGRKRPKLVPINGMAAETPASYEAMLTIDHLNVGATGATKSGHPLPDSVQIIDRITVHKRFVDGMLPRITNPANLRVITAFGDSMKPTLNPGDLLIIDTGIEQINVDGIYVLEARGELFIKRIKRRPVDGALMMISDNNPSGEPPDPLSGKYDVTLGGRVVWRWRGEAMM